MPPSPLRPAVFLDRDGVIIENRVDYVKSIAEVRFIDGAVPALARLARHDIYIVIATNQSAVGRGLIPGHVAQAINEHIVQHIVAAGGRIDEVFLCPHVPEAGCRCRKPAPGMLLDAAATLGIDLERSVMIGDALTDALAGLAAGAQARLVRTGRGAVEAPLLSAAGLERVEVAADLAQALAALEISAPWITKTPPSVGGVTA